MPKKYTINIDPLCCKKCKIIIDDVNIKTYIYECNNYCKTCFIDIVKNSSNSVLTGPNTIKQDLGNPARKYPSGNEGINIEEDIEEEEDIEDDEEDDEEEECEEEEEECEKDEEEEEDEEEKCCGNQSDSNSNNNNGIESTDFNNIFLQTILNSLNKIDSGKDTNIYKFNNKNDIIIKNGGSINNGPNNKKKGNKNDDDDNDDSKLEYEWLGADIKDIDDLIRVGQSYNPKKRKRYNLNLSRLNDLVIPLIELKNMIGMTDVKKIIFDQIIYYLQKLDDKNVDMLHTVIVGPPGVGKTQLTHIIAKIYNKLGFLKTDKVICAKRDDLIGEYVGQTAPRTRKVLEKALGGVLLLDEVYSLSPTSEKDFAREAIDMINVYLSEHSHDLVCVIAGYKEPTYEKFLAYNDGLARRFTHHFEIKGYTAEELTLIFKKYILEQKWNLMDTVETIVPFIEKNMKYFPNFGGDMTTLFACCKKTHSKRLLLIPTENELRDTKKKITIIDIEKGMKLFMDIKSKNNMEEDDKEKFIHMYS